jgi:hypothetical protein
MANHVLLNNVEHKDIKIITRKSVEYGDNVWCAPTFFTEFRSVQAYYPILFQKDNQTDTFNIVALFGFKNGENLFLNKNGWDANYIPLSIQRLPFLIGFQEVNKKGVTDRQRVITLDMDSPRVSNSDGMPLFLEYGGNSEYLETIANILETLHLGLEENKGFIDSLLKYQLIEPLTVDVELKDGSKNSLIGFHTINEDMLNKLNADAIVELHQAGYLQAIYIMLASQVHFRELVDRKNIKEFGNDK